MQLGGIQVENALLPISGKATRLLHDERERIRLVEQPELALRIPAVARVAEHAAAEEVTVKIGDQRADVSYAQRLPRIPDPAITSHQLLHRIGPVCLVRVVDRQVPP